LKPLTEKQAETLEAIIEHPHSTIEELGQIMGLKTETVYQRMKGLRDKGYLGFTNKARSIEILREV
jgi:DNA-binding IclR family transcriptional regulator